MALTTKKNDNKMQNKSLPNEWRHLKREINLNEWKLQTSIIKMQTLTAQFNKNYFGNNK
jgi:hypothetical protein